MFPEIENLDINNIFDIAIPLSVFIGQVRTIERCPIYNLNITVKDCDGNIIDHENEMYTVPYFFSEPVNSDMSRMYGNIPSSSIGYLIETFPEVKEEFKLWFDEINHRAFSMIKNAIRLDDLKKIDTPTSDDYEPIIIHMISGSIVKFNLVSPKELIIVAVDNTLANISALEDKLLKELSSSVSSPITDINWFFHTVLELAKSELDNANRDYSICYIYDRDMVSTLIPGTKSPYACMNYEVTQQLISYMVDKIYKKQKYIFFM